MIVNGVPDLSKTDFSPAINEMIALAAEKAQSQDGLK
jgi:hypothetical protein